MQVIIRKVANGYLVDSPRIDWVRNVNASENLHVFATFQEMCFWLEINMDKKK